MKIDHHSDVEISEALLDAIRSFPRQRTMAHCGLQFAISPFDLYATCPQCGTRLKVRAFTAGSEVEDVFDAVFEWMNQPGAEALARRRQEEIREDDDEAPDATDKT